VKLPGHIQESLNELRKTYPDANVVSRSQLKQFLRDAIPALVNRYIIGGRALKVCSGISPDFAAFASANGIAAFVTHRPGHVLNVVPTTSGPVLVDLSAIQFECMTDELDYAEHREEMGRLLDRVTRNPFSAVNIENVDWSDLYGIQTPRYYKSQAEALSDWRRMDASSKRTLANKSTYKSDDPIDSRYIHYMDAPDEGVVPWMRENPFTKPKRRSKRLLSWWMR
jgi:hypothetical protein